MPQSRNAMGRIAGSALGANRRSARCATKKLTTKAMGTAKELNVNGVLALTSSIRNSSNNTGVAAMRSHSSVVRRERTASPSCFADGIGR